jgi:SAM-dependent methyltransferase
MAAGSMPADRDVMTTTERPDAAQSETPPAAVVFEILNGPIASQIVYAGAKLGLADLIAKGVTDLAQLATTTETDPDALRRLLRGLGALGLVNRERDGGWRLTEVGEVLCSDHPQSVRQLTIMSSEHEYLAWSDPVYSIRTGRPAFDRVLGQAYYDYLADHPGSAAAFNGAMAEMVRLFEMPAVAAYDFTRSRVVVDVGGGTGSLLAHVLRTHEHLRGVLYDLPQVVRDAVPELQTGELADRCDLLGGDYLQSVPDGGDTYLMAFILHGMTDEDATRLLRNVRSVIPPDGELVALTFVLPDDDTPSLATFADLHMLVQAGGRERSRAEFDRLLGEAGFRIDRIHPHPTELNVLVATPV